MADTTQPPMNGSYPAQHAYPESYNHGHAAVNSVSNFQPAQSTTPSNAPPSDQKNGISKDEVGWYFVEQYYTNMSRSPEKLHLFYSRRSQLVFGTEAESVPVAIGQKEINDKFKQLDFQDCKVRVLNVDSQASFDNILISVIGEISNKSEPSRKFIQTFVLAEQPNGYYVLNDIFRYLVDEEEVVTEEATPAEAPAAAAPAPAEEQAVEAVEQKPAAEEATPEVTEAQVDNEVAVAQVDEKLEQAEEKEEEKAVEEDQTNGTEAEKPEVAEEVPAPAEPEAAEPEKPATPEPTPAEPVQKEAPAPEKEAAPPAKALPKTWANIASKIGAAAAAPVVPAVPAAPAKPAATPAAAPAAAAPAAAQPQSAPAPAPAPASAPAPAPAPASAPASAPAAAAPAAESTPSQPPAGDNAGWQTAGQDHKKSQSRAGEEQNVLAYIKNVNEKVDASLLKQTLSRFGKLKYFDVSRQKNCAFVEFAEPAGYAAALAANPHQIGSEQISVEERRPRGNAYGGNANYGAGRGGAGRGRGDRAGSQGRGGFQRDGRGGFAPRGRGGNVNTKARNQPQAA
ncbi:NTF2 and RRM domain protein [Aspergillus clavatus NRRL 1]|uniref:NTF2 and RRM domain protein n=1 Tax=Aspergillus clavatus (strain ATCC 1007 / CBS 513.65 / DSM 816 / NCTC 3887 / NRRL 1 / QM 1276 / 107) TaxID=344612 RepID=A1C4S1_ASPCL|nr:NTF2 and RRM domain protein [Aspergillus clavatus NRRL 1]EAW14689.1 NTF2 and RRM domain protein [Aspergillus clavatus NRRL 1]